MFDLNDKLSIEEVLELVNTFDGCGLISTDDQLLIEHLEQNGFQWTDLSKRDAYFTEEE